MNFDTKGIFEVHLGVKDRKISADFYQKVLSFKPALDIPDRDVTFLWIGERGENMIGLWGPKSPNPATHQGKSHFALRCSLTELMLTPKKLRELGVTPLDFNQEPTEEPDVLAWMPAASVYFVDPDKHSLEFITMLDAPPKPELGILKYSDWKQRL